MIDKDISYEDQRLTKKQKKKIKPVNQGGGPNYLGKQETVTVPKKWLSDPDHVVAELAYITPREKKILLDADLYGSLKGKPNRGPGGIPSLQGDLGGYDASPGGPDSESGDGSGGRNDKARAADIMTGKVSVTSPSGMQTEGYKGYDPNQRQYDGIGDFYGNPTIGQKIGTGLQNLFSNTLLGRIASTFGPLNNKDFYDQKVAPAGITNLSYDDYMDARLSGQIDAYGNPIGNTGGGDGGSASSQAQLIQQAAIANPIANPTVETPQGGVGELYAQYMRNLGYTL